MEDATEIASEGTAAETDAGSQAIASGEATGSAGSEGGQPEPTIKVGDREVPISVAENAIKVHERFTQESQELAKKRKEIEAREASTMEKEAMLGNLIPLMRDPRVSEALRGIDPALADAIPQEKDMAARAMLGENLRLRYELFTSKHTEFNDEQLSAIRAEAVRLAEQGKVDEAVDFESIGYRLFRDDVIEREAARRAEELLAAEREKLKKTRQAGTAGAGMQTIPQGVDPSKLSPIQKMQLGRLLAKQQSKKR